ncbi:MAG: dihydrofolate reductase [Burkholderiales bacterium]
MTVIPPDPDRRSRVTLVVAVARNGVIGAKGGMPWHLPDDLKRFKAITLGHTLVMGRKTHESIGRLLPGRRTVIVTRDPHYRAEGATIVASLEAALAASADDRETFVVGGGEIYVQALPLADRLLVTEIDAAPEGDTTFPRIDPAQWCETASASHRSADGLAFRFVDYERRRPAASH